MTQEFHRNHEACSNVIKRPEGLDQQILEILDRNFKRTPNSPVIALSPHKLRAIGSDLAQLGIASWGCLSKEMLDRIRPRVFEALGFRLPTGQHTRDLQVVHTFVVRSPGVIGQIFSKPSIAFTLGPVFLYPASFGCFTTPEDRQLLTEIATCLRTGVPYPAYQRWQMMQAQSLVMEYRGRECSPSPNVYCNALRLPEKFLPLSVSPCKDEAFNRFSELIQSGDGIPRKLWGVLLPEARDQISSRLEVADVVGWMNKRFASVRMQAKACTEMSDHLNEDSTNSDYEDIEIVFGACRQNLIEVCDFASLYFRYKLANLHDDPVNDLILSTGIVDREEWDENPAEYRAKKLQEHLQENLQGELGRAIQAVCECMSHQLIELPCTFEMARSIDSLQDVLDLSIDAEEGGFSYTEDLLPCFDRAIDVGNFEAGSAIRLLFPRSCVRDFSNRLSLIDDHIESQQGSIIRSMVHKANEIARSLVQIAQSNVDIPPPELELRIENFRKAIDLVLPQKSKLVVDHDLQRAMIPIVKGLLEWDVSRQAAEARGDGSSSIVNSPSAFYGCRKTAELLGALAISLGAQRSMMSYLFERNAERYGALLSDFIVTSNRNLEVSIRRCAINHESLRDILQEFDAARGAERMYAAAGKYADRLPAPLPYSSRQTIMLGRLILKVQDDLGMSVHSEANIRARDLACIAFWMGSDVSNPERQHTLRRLFEVIIGGQGVLPKEFMPLVFESVTQHARDFRAALCVHSLGESEFQRSVVYILGAFLTSSAHVQFGQRLEMARALRDAFNDRYSAGFSPDKEHRRKVSAAFDDLVGDGEKMGPVKALQQFSKRPEVQQLLTQLGLS